MAYLWRRPPQLGVSYFSKSWPFSSLVGPSLKVLRFPSAPETFRTRIGTAKLRTKRHGCPVFVRASSLSLFLSPFTLFECTFESLGAVFPLQPRRIVPEQKRHRSAFAGECGYRKWPRGVRCTCRRSRRGHSRGLVPTAAPSAEPRVSPSRAIVGNAAAFCCDRYAGERVAVLTDGGAKRLHCTRPGRLYQPRLDGKFNGRPRSGTTCSSSAAVARLAAGQCVPRT